MKQMLYYLKSNKGSGVVTVMLAMLFLTAFGTLALYLSYTSVKMSVAERTGMETDVNAYTCMDEVKAGIQQLVSDAINETYKDVMPFYSKENENISKSFKSEFNKLIVDCQYKIKDSDSTGYDLFTDNATKYDITTLEKMVREDRGYTVDIYTGSGSSTEGKGNAEGKGVVETTYEKDEDGNDVFEDGKRVPESFTLKDITLEFTGKDGYTTSVTTDIVIACPDVGYLLTQYSIKGIPNFAMVATKAINQTVGNGADSSTAVTVTGDVYAGEVNLDGDSTFKVRNYSTFICSGTINVAGGGDQFKETTKTSGSDTYKVQSFKTSPRLEMDNTSTVWADTISIGSLTSAAFYGTTYLQNDLVFSGNKSFVKLGSYLKNTTRRTGSFYGFGSSTTDPTQSSSIIANREGNKLSVSELGSLTLAGYSFISNSTRTSASGDESTGIRMGESASGKYNQMVYYAGAEKVQYYEYKFNSDGDKINSTGHYIEGTYPNCKYFSYKLDDSGAITTEKIYYDEEYDPQTNVYTIEQEKMAVISKTDYAKIIRFGLVGEEFKWENGQFVIDTSKGDDGYSLSYIDDSLQPGDALYQKTYADYHAHLSPVFEVIGQQYVVHFLLSFADPEDSNQYFIDSFNSNPIEIKNELVSHINMMGLNSGIANTASGSIYKDDNYNDITSALAQTIEDIKKNAEFIQEIFTNYCTTLSNEVLDTSTESGKYPSETPFDTYIYREKIEALSNNEVKEFKNSSGDVVALVVNGDYDFTTASKDTICLIISTGDVNVSDNFDGLILTNADINIKSDANFSQNYEAVLSAFQSTNGSEAVKDYFKRNITKNYTLDNGSTTENIAAYDINTMVYYNNWSE